AVDAARAPVSEKVERHHAVPSGESDELPAPHAGVAAGSVQQDEERAVVEGWRNVGQRGRPGVQIVHGGAVNLDVLRMQARFVTTWSLGVSNSTGARFPCPSRSE